MCRQVPFVQKSVFFHWYRNLLFTNNPLCTFRQNVATLYCLVRSSYPQLHGIVNLIKILQGGLEIVLLSFPLTDLHSVVHMCRNWPHIIDIRKGIFKLNILVTSAKYFYTSHITCVCKSLIVSNLIPSMTTQPPKIAVAGLPSVSIVAILPHFHLVLRLS